jgi:hypothetical protein
MQKVMFYLIKSDIISSFKSDDLFKKLNIDIIFYSNTIKFTGAKGYLIGHFKNMTLIGCLDNSKWFSDIRLSDEIKPFENQILQLDSSSEIFSFYNNNNVAQYYYSFITKNKKIGTIWGNDGADDFLKIGNGISNYETTLYARRKLYDDTPIAHYFSNEHNEYLPHYSFGKYIIIEFLKEHYNLDYWDIERLFDFDLYLSNSEINNLDSSEATK